MKTLSVRVAVIAATMFIRTIVSQDGLHDAKSLVKTSDAVVIGQGSVVDGTEGAEKIMIKVDRVIKGDLTTGSSIVVLRANRKGVSCAEREKRTSAYKIWFLRLKNGEYSLEPSTRSQICSPLDAYFETSSQPLPSQWSYARDLPDADKLAYEYAATINAHGDLGPHALMTPMSMNGVSPTTKRDVFSKLSESPSIHVHMAGILGLLRIGDVNTLRTVAKNYDSLSAIPLWTAWEYDGQEIPVAYGENGTDRPSYAPAITNAIMDIRNASKETVGDLGTIADTAAYPIELRRAAAEALQFIHTAQAVEKLAPLLNENDEDLLVDAIGGMASFATGVPPEDPEQGYRGVDSLAQQSEFKSIDTAQHFAMGKDAIMPKKDYYLKFWQQWWSLNQTAVRALSNH